MYQRVMHRQLNLVIIPSTEPLTVNEAKAHLRVENDTEDDYIAALIETARAHLDGRDGWLSRALMTQTWDYTLDAFPMEEWICLPLPPVQSITSITYKDVNGNAQTFNASNYSLSADKHWKPRVHLAATASWPGTWNAPEAVTIRTINGYGGTVEDVPAPIKQALLLLIGHWYENRETVTLDGVPQEMPLAVEALLEPYMVTAF